MTEQRHRAGLVRVLGMWLVAALPGLAVPLVAPATVSADGPPTGTGKPVLFLHGYRPVRPELRFRDPSWS